MAIGEGVTEVMDSEEEPMTSSPDPFLGAESDKPCLAAREPVQDSQGVPQAARAFTGSTHYNTSSCHDRLDNDQPKASTNDHALYAAKQNQSQVNIDTASEEVTSTLSTSDANTPGNDLLVTPASNDMTMGDVAESSPQKPGFENFVSDQIERNTDARGNTGDPTKETAPGADAALSNYPDLDAEPGKDMRSTQEPPYWKPDGDGKATSQDLEICAKSMPLREPVTKRDIVEHPADPSTHESQAEAVEAVPNALASTEEDPSQNHLGGTGGKGYLMTRTENVNGSTAQQHGILPTPEAADSSSASNQSGGQDKDSQSSTVLSQRVEEPSPSTRNGIQDTGKTAEHTGPSGLPYTVEKGDVSQASSSTSADTITNSAEMENPSGSSRTKAPAASANDTAPPVPDVSANKIPKLQTPQEKTLADLKAQKAALIASLSTLPHIQELMTSRNDQDNDGEPTETDVMEAANKIVKEHIKLLHEYNEMKDAGQGLMGLIADQRGVRIVEVQDEFGINAKD